MDRGTHRYPPMERVIYGVPLAEALDEEANRLDARAVYVIASGTLNARPTSSTAFVACSATGSQAFAPRSAPTRPASTWWRRRTRPAR